MSVVGIDFGNHSSYVSVVKTGGIETIDNDYSYRATPTAVSFTDLRRFTGNSASSQCITNFRNTFCSFKNLIGLKFADPIAQQEMSLCNYQFTELADGYIGISANYLGESKIFTISQLVAMMLTDLKDTSLRHISIIAETVFSVPCFFTETQRRCFVSACSIASIQPKAIISDGASVAFAYGLFKVDLPEEGKPPRYVVFVNVGYSSTQVTFVAFNKSSIRILTNIGSPAIGGRNFDRFLFQNFAQIFQQKYHKDVMSNRKAVLKLMAESESLKKRVNIISSELPLRLECFMDDIDFVSSTSREELDCLSANLYENFEKLLTCALEKSTITVKDIHSVEIIGGSSRINGLRKVITKVFNKEPSTTLNADEAVSRGCAIKAALLSSSIRIRPIKLKDSCPAEFSVFYHNKNNEVKELKIFKFDDAIPNTKEIVFPAFNDFTFDVYEATSLSSSRKIASCRSFGRTVEDCSADKLVFHAEVTSAGVFTITRAYFLENQKVTEPLPAETSEAAQNEAEQKTTTKVVKKHHVLDFEFTYTETFKFIDFQACEQEMIKKVISEQERAAHRNSVEEFIYSMRSLIDSEYRDFATPEDSSTISQALNSCENWLYEEGEFSTSEIYQAKLLEMQNISLPVQSRFECFKNVSEALKPLEHAFLLYRKHLDTFSAEPDKYSHLSQADVEEYAQKLSQIESFIMHVSHLLNNHPKTKLLPVSVDEIHAKRTELSSTCDKIVFKAQNPPQPKEAPPPPPPENDIKEEEAVKSPEMEIEMNNNEN